MIEIFDTILYLLRKSFSIYVIAWLLPGSLTLAVVSLGSFKHIIFIDKQLAKQLDKYYDKDGYMLPKYQMSYSIGSRFIGYCLFYPIIRYRTTTKSLKFRFFMWANCLGMLGWSGVLTLIALEKVLNIVG
ncbi:hypothetical protein L1D14_09170 [Vibrio tubiashii]|nr:hypothetical protein [Vibrio tubiashii]MCG9576408.1 hypothetical protein [Vibrio tubiashii]